MDHSNVAKIESEWVASRPARRANQLAENAAIHRRHRKMDLSPEHQGMMEYRRWARAYLAEFSFGERNAEWCLLAADVHAGRVPMPTDTWAVETTVTDRLRFKRDMKEGRIPMPSNVIQLPVAPPPAIVATPFQWADPTTITPRAWLYGGLMRRQVMVTVAHPGVGKSALTIAEGVAMASGRMLLHDRPAGRLRVWIWNGEDPADELQRRITAAMVHYAIDPAEIEGWLFVDSGRTSPMVIAHANRDGVTVNQVAFDALVATIRANAIDVLILDPFVSLHAVPENDNGAIDLVAKTFARLADITGCAVHLVHHSRKTGGEAVDVEHARGASALLGAVRSARTLNVMSQEEAAQAGVDNRFAFVRIDEGKANMAPRSDKATWIRHHSVWLSNGPDGVPGDSVGVVTRWQWPDAMDGVTMADLNAVQTAITAGKWRENVQASDWVGRPIAEALGLDLEKAADKAKIRALVRRWIASGALVVLTGKDAKGNDRPFVEVGKSETRLTPPPH